MGYTLLTGPLTVIKLKNANQSSKGVFFYPKTHFY